MATIEISKNLGDAKDFERETFSGNLGFKICYENCEKPLPFSNMAANLIFCLTILIVLMMIGMGFCTF